MSMFRVQSTPPRGTRQRAAGRARGLLPTPRLRRLHRLAPIAALALASAALAPALSSGATTAPKPPRASTGSALHVSETGVELQARVNPRGQETTCYFQFGPTTAYGQQSPTAAVGGGKVAVKVNQPISGLQPGATYHYRIVASSAGGTTEGQDRTFTTKQVPLKFVIAKGAAAAQFKGALTITGTLSGAGGANHQVILQSNAFPYLNGFADLGTPASTNAEGGFSLRVPSLTQNTELRVRTLDATPTYSHVVNVHVAALVTLQARSPGKGTVRLSGTVTPAEAGAPVVFQWIRSGRPPTVVGSATVRSATPTGSRFGATLGIRHSGYYRALVRVSNGKQVSGASRTIFLHATIVRKRRRRRR
jgi:hypothetical protein